MASDATKKTGKKTSHMVNFIVSMALMPDAHLGYGMPIGLKVAKYYNKLALEMNEKWCSSVPKSWELAVLPLDSDVGRDYRYEMDFCVEFAYANQCLMIARVKDVLIDFFHNIYFSDMINIAHNYAAMEHHFRKNIMVHRKGATKARKGKK